MWRCLSVTSWFYCLEPSSKIYYGRMGGGESQFRYERMRWERTKVQKFTTMTFPSKWKPSQKAPFLKVSTPPLAPGTGNSVLAHGLENFTQAICALSKISWLWVHVFLCICLRLFLLPPSSLPVPCCLDYDSFVVCFEKVVSHYTADTDST